MDKKSFFEQFKTVDAFRATLLLRVSTVVVVIISLPSRNTIPLWMDKWFQTISYPLFVYSLVLLIFYKKISAYLQKHSNILIFDLIITIGILQIGGGWRSSYFVYTLTAIIIFTIFLKRKGAYISSFFLAAAVLIKDPSAGFPTSGVFDISTLDMRLGAALFYISAGLIFGYFSTLIERLHELSDEKIEETRRRTATEQKMRLALDLHDGLKSKVAAILLLFKSMMKESKSLDKNTEKELQRLWKWLHYLQIELSYLVETLKSEKKMDSSYCNLVSLAQEEAKIIESMTGFIWNISSQPAKVDIPFNTRQSITRFFSEALMNAWKHSGTTRGTIDINSSNNTITIAISDNGKGFIYSDKEDKKTSGLKSLKQRAEELNGNLTIQTAPKKGCTLILTFPTCLSGK